MTPLRYATPQEWVTAVLADFDSFLCDHAAAEKKASAMAMTMVSRYPDRLALVQAMSELAAEELTHFREVVRLLCDRGIPLRNDTPDPYIQALRKHIRQGPENYLLDQLLLGGIIEARGHERFGLIANALPDGNMKKFYDAITRSEARHDATFIELAYRYITPATVDRRLDALLDIEATITANLPLRAALH